MGFEVVVRPVVLPDIRPRPRRSLPPADDPEKGFAVIRGNGFHQGSQSLNWTASTSQSRPVEVKRRVDETRVYQKDSDGNINRENFVDIQVANKIWLKGGRGPTVQDLDEGQQINRETGNIEEKQITFYQRPKQQDNIEILKKDVMIENEGQ